jgi:A/G-specific adenine glycosylase
MQFSEKIIAWYKINKRDLPWRNTDDPYKIWVSEIILQQTRVSQGLDYYNRFILKFPDVSTLAVADEDEVLKVVQGAGYYSRFRNMIYTAKQIMKEYSGKFPVAFSELIKLKGIGNYTAAAIASFSEKEIVPVVDGNVYRIYSRFYGLKVPVDSSEGKKSVFKIASANISQNYPDIFNQAIMDFGAMICTPKSYKCENCPVKSHCHSFKNNSQENFPVKRNKTESSERRIIYADIRSGKKIFLRKRVEKDIWKGLYDLPEIDITKSGEKTNYEEIHGKIQDQFSHSEIKSIQKTAVYVHKLTHRKLLIEFYKIEIIKPDVLLMGSYLLTDIVKLADFPVPRIIEKYFKKVVLI